MAYYSIPLTAGVPYLQEVPGSLILVDGIDGAAGVDVTPILNGSRQTPMPARKAGFKYRTAFDGVELNASANCTVRIFLTTNDVSLGFTDGAQVNVAGAVSVLNGTDARIPVDLANGTVTVTATNVGINNDDAHPVPTKRAALTNIAAKPQASIGIGAAVALVSDATLKRLLIRNASADAVIAIGGADVTLANAVIRLNPGDTWDETDAAGAAWYATADKAATPINLLGMK
jgi:hypothetical protein